MARVSNPPCPCICTYCREACPPEYLYVTLEGVRNRDPAVCGDCDAWNRKWELRLVFGDEFCYWENVDALPCDGSSLWLIPAWNFDYNQFAVELEVSENGNYMGSFYRFDGQVQDTACLGIRALGGFTQSANPPDECDWSVATATVSLS